MPAPAPPPTGTPQPAAAEAPPRVLPLDGATNFRDLGGYVGDGGRRVRWRRLFRSDHLGALSAADHAQLARIGIARAFDFRGESERAAAPYAIDGITHHPLTIEPAVVQRMTAWRASGRPLDAAQAARMMQELYRGLVTERADRFAEFFARLLAADEAVVFHCTAGKDRTGVAAALLLHALGVDDEAVAQDYLLTNAVYRRPEALRGRLDLPEEVLQVLWSVQPGFLAAALDEIARDFGSVDRYLAERLGVGADERRRLQSRYLDGG